MSTEEMHTVGIFKNSHETAQRRLSIFIIVALVLTLGLMVGHGVDWRGSTQLHTVMEAMAIRTDISERKAMDRMKSEFVSTVSHELRTPLTSIKGSLGIVASGALGKLPEKTSGMIDIAYKNSERLIDLVNDILDMEKLESGRMKFNFKEVDLTRLVSQSVTENIGYANQFGISFEFKTSLPGSMVMADQSRLSQVLNNLLSNASKFSPKGGNVEITVTRHDTLLRVSVIDHGPGIPETFHDKIFDKFTQADSSDTRQKGGTGLGLNISKSIVEIHSGLIGFNSTPGQGTTFYFDLPELKQRLFANDIEVQPSQKKPPRALIPAATLKDAKEILQRDQFDLVIVDIGLADGSGLDLLEQIKNNGNQLTPVIIFPGQDVESEVSCKVEATLVKSRTPNDKLIQTIKALIDEKAATV